MNNVSKKTVTVYQSTSQSKWVANLATIATGGNDYLPLSEMEPVLMLRYPSEMEDSDILESIFYLGNNSEDIYPSLNYSLSMGDYVVIDDITYVCQAIGWGVVEFDDTDESSSEENTKVNPNRISPEKDYSMQEDINTLIGMFPWLQDVIIDTYNRLFEDEYSGVYFYEKDATIALCCWPSGAPAWYYINVCTGHVEYDPTEC